MTSAETAHQEKNFESYVISKLAAQGWKVGETSQYDTERALYPEDVVAWLQTTQEAKWDKLCKDNGDKAQNVLLDKVASALDKHCASWLRQAVPHLGLGPPSPSPSPSPPPEPPMHKPSTNARTPQ